MLAAQSQCWRSRFRYRLGRLAAAKVDVEQALALAESTHDRATVARCLNYLSHLHPPAEARVFAERALQESLAIEHPQLIITSHNSMGIVYRHAADYRQALVHYEQALASCEMLGDLRGISMMTYNIGLVYENLGDNALAREHHEHSLQLKRQIGDRAGAARRLSVLAYHHLLNEEFETASAYLDESQLLCEEVGDRFRLTHAWLIRAVIEFITMDFQGAQATLEHGLPVVQDIDSGIRLVEYHNLLGLVHLGQGQLQPAEKHFFDCFDAAVVEQRPYVYWLSLMGYALLLWARNNTAESIRISAVVQRLRLLGTEVDLRYAFDPHIYRVEQRIGAEAWATAQDDTAAITLDDLFAEIASKIRM